MRGEPPIPHDVVKEHLSHRVPREAVPPVVGLIPQVHGAITRLHLDFGTRPKPQTRVAPISGEVNRHADLAAFPILMSHHGVSVKVHARVAVIPTRVKADSFRGFQTGASQILWRRTGGSPCGQELHFARTMTRPSFGP